MPFTKGWKKAAKEKEAKSATTASESKESTSPKHKAFYIEKEKGIWRLVIAEIQDDKVIGKQVKECDSKAMSLENFKIKFAEIYYFGK